MAHTAAHDELNEQYTQAQKEGAEIYDSVIEFLNSCQDLGVQHLDLADTDTGLTKAQTQEASAMFKAMDKDGSGTIS